jgi:acyl-CoA reductase-like NAD-dependent aldehyde dehydrogenase
VLEVSRGAECQVEPNRVGVVAAITPCSFPNMALCDRPGVAALSVVGSTKIARVVYRRASGNAKPPSTG